MELSELSRAQGCFLGQCAGDALGQMVEFQSKASILRTYPNGVRDMADGGTFGTLAGQPTDDTELALMLARSIIKENGYDAKKVFNAYCYWYGSKPFDCGNTISSALSGTLNHYSQANGALMRISPLGIYGSRFNLEQVADWAMQDARLTHPNTVCQKTSAIYATTIAEAIATGLCNKSLYENALIRAQKDIYYEPSVYQTLKQAKQKLPDNFSNNSGWVLLAFQNAFYHLFHTDNVEEAVIATVNEGGDTDTNAAICGALLGAVYGVESIPERWRKAVLNCCPSENNSHVKHPRPNCFWAIDVLELAEKLLKV